MSDGPNVNTGDMACVICLAKPGEFHVPAAHRGAGQVLGRRVAERSLTSRGAEAPPAAPAHRMTLGEVTRRLLDLQARPARERSSVTVTRNARHVYQFDVTVFAGDTGADTPEQAKELAMRLADELEAKYPTPAPEGADGEGAP